jgi:methionyl-tRNA formyltransferase
MIFSSRPWGQAILKYLSKDINWLCMTQKKDLESKIIETYKPHYLFFTHWSWKIPEEIFTQYECIMFHMTDLPLGRGGSPLQNLIARGVTETKITAFKCVSELDAGPIYMKQPLSLYGNAEEIYMRADRIIAEMINKICILQPTPVSQSGKATYFSRRTPEESNIVDCATLESAHDYIRMLDAEGYPPAFLKTGRFKVEFSRATLRWGRIEADATITIAEE